MTSSTPLQPNPGVGRGHEAQPRVPDAFLIGVPRAATTSLYYALGEHPAVYAPSFKEACFTCPDLDPGLRRTQTRFFEDRAEYLALFAPAGREQLALEGCIYNIYSPQAPRRMRSLNSDARMLVQLRDPVEQMYSNHGLKLIMVDTTRTFEAELAAQDRARGGRTEQPLNLKDYDLRDKASALPGLRRFIDEFGRDRVHVTLFEDFADDPSAVLRSVLRFLEVDDSHVPTAGVHVPNRVARLDSLNRAMASGGVVGGAKRLMPSRLHPAARRVATIAFRLNRRRAPRTPLEPKLRDRLRDEFGEEVRQLSELTGMDLASRWWGVEAAS